MLYCLYGVKNMPILELIGKDKVINYHQEVPYRALERRYSFDMDRQHNTNNGSENITRHDKWLA